MIQDLPVSCTAFEGPERIATGGVVHVALAVKAVEDRGTNAPVLVFDDRTSHQVELDLRGTHDDVRERALAWEQDARAERAAADAPAPTKKKGPGRPKLGVVSKEVTLLPRHWEWLAKQRGGASGTLRRLVDEARKAAGPEDVREAQEAAYKFMLAMVGNEPGFIEATRALFANDAERFESESAKWPRDPRIHARMLAARAFRLGGATAAG